MIKSVAVLGFGLTGLVGGHLAATETALLEHPDHFVQPTEPTVFIQQSSEGPVITHDAQTVFLAEQEVYERELAAYNSDIAKDRVKNDWLIRELGVVAGELVLVVGVATKKTLSSPAGRQGFVSGFSMFAPRNR